MKKILIAMIGLALGLAFFVPGNVSAATKKTTIKDYDYELIDQQPQEIITMQPGEFRTVWIEVRNTGAKTWYDNVHLGTGSQYGDSNRQRDYMSQFINEEWLSYNRVAGMSNGFNPVSGIVPGWVVRFQFNIKAPSTPGVYKEYFNPVVDGSAWMKDMGIYWDIRVLGANNYYPKEIYLWPDQGTRTAKVNVGDSIYVGLDTANPNSLLVDGWNNNILQYTGRKLLCNYSQDINMSIDTCNKIANRALYEFRAIASGVSEAGIQGYPSIIVTIGDDHSNNDLVVLSNGGTKSAKIGDNIMITTPISNTNVFYYNTGVLKYLWTGKHCDNPAPYGGGTPVCNSETTQYDTYFEVIGGGLSVITQGGDFSANLIVDRDYYSYNSGTTNVLQNAKRGDIIIVNMSNPGDGGYQFNNAEFPANRINLISSKHFAPTSGLMGDFGSDQWVFEVLDGNITNYIQIRATQPWTGGSSFTAFLLNINPVIPCASGLTGCAF